MTHKDAYWKVSNDCPSLATTLANLSGSRRISRRNNFSSFDKIHESIQVLTSSYELKCWSAGPCVLERDELSENEPAQHLESTTGEQLFTSEQTTLHISTRYFNSWGIQYPSFSIIPNSFKRFEIACPLIPTQ
nr:hypothetical transcript [Hymenolepis microstoma]CUU00287.1 hypothetical transcript [Hymenolepis microstoma]